MAIIGTKQKHKKFYLPERTYRKYCESFEMMDKKAGDYVPAMENMKNDILPNLQDNIVFLLWLQETGRVTSTNRDMHRYIHDILQENLEIIK